jgi:uncharacterized iron-regulated membrane protein
MSFKKLIGKIHLWLGLTSGLLVLFLGITGCILAFEREIEDAVQTYRFTEHQNKPLLPPSELKRLADKALPDKLAHSIAYQDGLSSGVIYYNADPEYYYAVFLNPYTGEVLKVKNMNDDFFRIVLMGHYYLWLPPTIGQPILASATLIFVVMLISGIVLWWPKNKAARKQRFSIKWNARWRRVNYDMHNVLGFYASWFAIFLAITGLVMGFQWVAKSIYWTASGGKSMVDFYESRSDSTKIPALKAKVPAIDYIWERTMKQRRSDFKGSVEMHTPLNDTSSVEVAINPEPTTYWQTDYLYYDQHTFKEIEVKHPYGKYKNASGADKLMRMNYDIHIGAIGGLPGKILAFIASLFAASLPVTGFMIWLGRRKKSKGKKVEVPEYLP